MKTREIKFKGKRIDNGEWVEGSLVMVCNGESLKRYPCIVISYNHDAFDWYEVGQKTVCQFTGLLDKNGVEIYEGDIVKCDVGFSEVAAVITFFDGKYQMITNDQQGQSPVYQERLKRFEVIGNIYESPNLLEK